MLNVPPLETCLSEFHLSNILVTNEDRKTTVELPINEENGQFVWSEFDGLLRENDGKDRDELYASGCVLIRKNAVVVSKYVKTLGRGLFFERYGDVIDFYGVGMIERLYELGIDGGNAMDGFALTSAVFEWCFVNLLDVVAGKSSAGMRYALEEPEIEEFFDEGLLNVLKLIVGPPVGLNLRNLVWHGFVEVEEFDDCYFSFFLVVILSTARLIKEKLDTFVFVKESLDLNYFTEDLFQFDDRLYLWDEKFTSNLSSLENLLQKSEVVLPSRICKIINCFRINLCSENKNNYVNFLVGVLPEFEHMIRIAFTCLNNLPESIIHAQYKQHFTILDLFLEENPTLEGEEHNFEVKNNIFISEMGSPFINLMYDLFRYMEGPRIRDKLSHGELELDTLSRILIDRLISAMVFLVIQFADVDEQDLEFDFQNSQSFIRDYIACYHPKTYLQRGIIKGQKNWAILNDLVISFPFNDEMKDDLDPNELIYICRRKERSEISKKVLEYTSIIQSKLLEYTYLDIQGYQLRNLPTLFSKNAHLSKVSVLRKIAKTLSQLCLILNEKISSFQTDVLNNSLSSRGEESYYKLLGLITPITEIFQLFLFITELELLNEKEFPSKKVLSLFNNLFTELKRMRSKLDTNNWIFIIEQFTNLKPLLITRYKLPK